MSTNTSACCDPPSPHGPAKIIISSVTGTVVSKPCITLPRVAHQNDVTTAIDQHGRVCVIGRQHYNRIGILAREYPALSCA